MIVTKNKSILLLIGIVAYFILYSCSNKIVLDSRTVEYKDYLISFEEIEFHFMDSIYPFTVFIEPNRSFYFRDGFVESSDSGTITYRRLDDKSKKLDYKDKYVKKSDSILQINSFFPLLIKHDSSIINYDPYEFIPIDLIYELEYSFILNNLKEPKFYGNNDLESIRVVRPLEIDLFPRDYSAIRLDFGEENNLLTYSEGKYDSNSNYRLTVKDSCIVTNKHISDIIKILKAIDFDNEYYFAEVGLNVYAPYLIEYKTFDKYYAFERHLFSQEQKNNKLWKLLVELNSIKNKYTEKK